MSDGRRGLQAVAWGAEQNSGRHATACAQNAVSLLRPRQQTASLSLRLSLRGCSHFYIPPPPHIDLTDHSRYKKCLAVGFICAAAAAATSCLCKGRRGPYQGEAALQAEELSRGPH
eukprot:scaffold291094_cov17-Tisochrysis_lutea.AAC.2